MTCPMESLYQLEFEVKSIALCERAEDPGCGMIVSVQFLNHPEQVVCEVPMNGNRQADGGNTTEARSSGSTAVGKGKSFTFAMSGAGGSGGGCGGGCGGAPKPIRVTVRLQKLADGSRSELGTGNLEIVPSLMPRAGERHRSPPPSTAADEQTVQIKGCGASASASPGGAVASLVVNARARGVGPVVSAPLEKKARAQSCSGHQPQGQGRDRSVYGKQPAAPRERMNDGCCGAAAAAHAQVSQPPQQRSCRGACGIAGGQSQNTTVDNGAGRGGGLDGEQNTSAKNKSAIQQHITSAAEAFVCKVLNIVKESNRE